VQLLSNHHFLLVTLVIWNAAAMEALPLFLDRLADPVTAVVLSVTVVLIFGAPPVPRCARCTCTSAFLHSCAAAPASGLNALPCT
jgi:hypothetical protein